MKKSYQIRIKIIPVILVLLSALSCVEPVELSSENYESILVIEGIITDEFATQKINLSRSYKIDENGPAPVSQAEVLVYGSNGDTFNFKESDSAGMYKSEKKFQVKLGVEYTLHIETANGTYESSPVSTNSKTEITSVKSDRVLYHGEDGVAITVSGSSDSENKSYYKYEYEETYEIRSPYEKRYNLVVNDDESLEVVPKPEQDYICYVSKKSQNLILSNTTGLTENNLDGYLVRFISKDDYELSYRYSILVKQLEISPTAYSYYNTLSDLSESESIFSQYQPGFLSGNLSSLDNRDEKVIGFFTTASIDKERLFFSYTDYFDPHDVVLRPSHHSGLCERFTPPRDILIDLLENGNVSFFGEDPPGVYSVINSSCVDCTLYGDNEQPEFWIE